MDVILRESQLDTKIKRCIMRNVIVPKLEYAEVWEGNAKLAKTLETVPMIAAKRILGCSKTACNTALRAELGIYSLKTNRDLRKLKWYYRVNNMQRKRLPAIVDRFEWKIRTKGKAGIRWDKVVENVWKDIGGNKKRDNVNRGRRRVQDKNRRHDRIKRKEVVETESKRGSVPQDIRRVGRGDRNDNIFTRPITISDMRPRPTRKKEEVYQ